MVQLSRYSSYIQVQVVILYTVYSIVYISTLYSYLQVIFLLFYSLYSSLISYIQVYTVSLSYILYIPPYCIYPIGSYILIYWCYILGVIVYIIPLYLSYWVIYIVIFYPIGLYHIHTLYLSYRCILYIVQLSVNLTISQSSLPSILSLYSSPLSLSYPQIPQ